jgi:hypothetical protein
MAIRRIVVVALAVLFALPTLARAGRLSTLTKEIADTAPIRYSQRRADAHSRRARLPETLTVDPAYFDQRRR